MTTLSLTDSMQPTETVRRAAFFRYGAFILAAWLAAGVLSAANMSSLEAAHCGALLLAIGLGLWLGRGAAGLAGSAAGRLWCAGVFMAGTVALAPEFQRSVAQRGLMQSGAQTQLSALLSLSLAASFWFLWRAANIPSLPKGDEQAPPAIASQIERFLLAPKTRLHLAALVMLVAIAGTALAGLPLKSALPRAVFAATLALCLRPLLDFAAQPAGVRAIHGALAVALGASVLIGGWRYLELRSKTSTVAALLAQDQEADAVNTYTDALALNEVLQTKGPVLDLETHWALYRERKGEYESSLIHWRRIAEQRGIDPTEMLPIRRVLCEMGDSLTAWRRLVYHGFHTLTDPELTPGIESLGDKPGGDARGKLLAALLAWELHRPEAERRRRLEEVRKVAPNEPTACNLLKRLGADVPDHALYLPGEMIVGRAMTARSGLGGIEELGEVDTLVVLNEGRWEAAVHARGTPLHEEWPIIRVLFNGREITRTQVNRAETHEVPFTFEVNRGNIYRITIVFQNRQEDLVGGRIARRGLEISGISFRMARE